MNHRCIGITTLLLACPVLFAEDTPKKMPAASVVAEPKATADWLASVFTVQNNQILVAGKPSDKFFEAQLKFTKPTEIQIFNHRMIADQEGLYPMIIGPVDAGYDVTIYTPFYAFLDEIIESDGLPGYANHPKNEAMTLSGFRKIAECLHAHFTKETGSLPAHYRVVDEISYPSEHYVWKVDKNLIILTAYDGNDSDGIHLRITSKLTELEELRKRKPTTEKIFDDWGDPLPSLKSTVKQ